MATTWTTDMLAIRIAAAGFGVVAKTPWSCEADGEIRLGIAAGRHHVQVGLDYAYLCVQEGDGEDWTIRFVGRFGDVDRLLAAIRRESFGCGRRSEAAKESPQAIVPFRRPASSRGRS